MIFYSEMDTAQTATTSNPSEISVYSPSYTYIGVGSGGWQGGLAPPPPPHTLDGGGTQPPLIFKIKIIRSVN